MNIYFINPPFKAEYGKFSRESRSPAITKSGALYYPLWLIYAALYSSKQGHNVSFLDAPAKQLNEAQSLNIIRKTDNEHSLFVLDTSTPSIKSDVAFAGKLKALYPHSFVVLVGTHPSACAEETLGYSNAVDAVAIGEYDCIVKMCIRDRSMGGVVYLLNYAVDSDILRIALGVPLGCVLYTGISLLTRSEEIHYLIDMIKKRK